MSALDALLPRPEIIGWPTLLPGHLSPSSLKMWMRCREQWRRRYVLGEKERPGAAMIWGSAHNFALVDTNFGQKVTSGTDLTVGDVELAFAEGFDKQVGIDDDIAWGDDKPGDLKDRGVALAAEYHRQVSATVQPLAVEESFSLSVPGVPVPVIGRMDVTEETRTIDLKTGKKREMKPDNAFQGRVYQLARPLPMEFHLATKTKAPGIYTPKEWPEFGFAFSEFVQLQTERVLADLARDIVATYVQFGPEQPWPGAFTYGWACGFCGFRPTCSYWAEAPHAVSFNAPALPDRGKPALPAAPAPPGEPLAAGDDVPFGTPPALPSATASGEGGVNESSPARRSADVTSEADRRAASLASSTSPPTEAAVDRLLAEEEALTRSLENIAVKDFGAEKLREVRAAIDKNAGANPDDPQARVDFLKRVLVKAIEKATPAEAAR